MSEAATPLPDRAVEPPPALGAGGDGGAGVPPMVYVEARRGFGLIDLAELWRHRELLWVLAVRDLTVRYRQTLVGVAWAVVQPATTMAIFLVLFGLLGRQPSTGHAPFGLVVLCGLLPWQLFAGVVSGATQSLVANQNLIGKVYFPRLILPLAAAVPPLADHLVGLVLLLGVMLYHGVLPGWGALLVPVLSALTVVAGLAVGVGLAALNALYRDVGHLVPFLLQVGFFISPVVYEADALIPEGWRALHALNPLAGLIGGYRAALLGEGGVSAWAAVGGLGVMALALVAGLAYFRRVERFLADRI